MGLDSILIVNYYDTLGDFPSKVENDRPFAIDKSTGKLYLYNKSHTPAIWTEVGTGGGSGTPGGSNTQVQFNDGGSFGGSANFTYDKVAKLLEHIGKQNFYETFDDDIYSSILGDNLLGYGIKGVGSVAQLDSGDIVLNAVFDATPLGGDFMSGSYYMDADGGQTMSVIRKQRVGLSATDGATWASKLALRFGATLDLQGVGNSFKIKTDSGNFKFQDTYLELPASTVDSPQLRFKEGFNMNSPQKGDMWWNGTELIFNNGAQNIDLLGGIGGDKDYIWSNTELFSVFLTNSGLRTKLAYNSEIVNVYLYDAMSTGVWQMDEGFQYSDRIRLVGISTKAGKSRINILGSGGTVGTGTFFEQIENIFFVNQQSSAIPFSIGQAVHIKAKNVYFKCDNDTDDAQPFFYLSSNKDFSITGDFTFMKGDAPVLGVIGGYSGSLELKVGDGEIEADTIYGGNNTAPNGVTGSYGNYTIGKIGLFFKNTPTTGTFDLTWNAETVSGLAFDISEGDLQTALRTITGLGSIVVSKTDNDFSVSMVGVDVPLVQAFTVTDNTDGVLFSNILGSGNWQETFLRSQPVITGGTYDVTLPGFSTTLNWNDNSIDIQNALRILSGLPNLTVSGDMTSSNGIIITAVGYTGDLAWGIDLSGSTTTPSQLTISAYSPNAIISVDQSSYVGNINKDELGLAENLKYNAYKMATVIDDISIAGTTDETSMIGSEIGSLDIPANTLKIGDVIRLKATGVINTTGTPDGTIKIYLGGTEIASSTVTLTSLTKNYFEAEIDITVRTITTLTETGSVYASGKTMVQGALFGSLVGRAIYTPTDVSLDTAVDNTIDATYQFSVADPDNSITVRSFIVERL